MLDQLAQLARSHAPWKPSCVGRQPTLSQRWFRKHGRDKGRHLDERSGYEPDRAGLCVSC